MVKYDDWSWHSGGDFPADLPSEAGATHIAMFVAWALLHGLAGDIHLHEFPEPLARLRERSITPGQFFLEACDGKFTDEDLSALGNRFAAHYYEGGDTPGHYYADYAATVGVELPSIYEISDTWDTYEQIEPFIQQRFEEWQMTSQT
jgi:hypothetical protein